MESYSRVLNNTKLKGKTLDWLRFNFNRMKAFSDDLLKELHDMFHESLNKSELKRKFENRIWQRDQTFQDYLHAKVILANRILIDEKEMIDSIIDGILVENLRDHREL